MGLTKDDITAVALRGYEDPRFFCRYFLQEWFSGPMPWVHLGTLAILTRKCNFLLDFNEGENYGLRELRKIESHFVYKEDPARDDSRELPIFEIEWDGDTPRSIQMVLSRHTLIMMPRGYSKTTLAKAANLWKIYYKERKFPLYVSETMSHAIRQLRDIGNQVSSNAKLRAVFGELKPEQRQGYRWSESEGELQLMNEICLAARGRGGQVRGVNVNAVRPDDIVFDDLEDEESVATPEQRAKSKEWFMGALKQVLPRLDKSAAMTGLGTLLHREALLTMLMEDPDWTVVRFGAIDRNGEALWPDAMTLEDIEKEKQSYATKGLLHIFYLELFNTIRAPETAKFRPENIIVRPRQADPETPKAIAIDPAISDKRDADFCSFGVVELYDQGIVHVLESYSRRGMTPREQVDKYFELIFKFQLKPGDAFGVEGNAYQAALVHLLREEMFRRGFYFEVEKITQSTRKHERVEGILQPRYASGYVTHQRHFPELETQLLDWPNGKKDAPDAVSMAISLLDRFAPMAASSDMGASEAPPLAEVFGGDWRRY